MAVRHKVRKCTLISITNSLPQIQCDCHHRSMYTSIGLNNVDFIGRLENLLSGFRYVADNIDTNSCAKVSHLNTQGKYN